MKSINMTGICGLDVRSSQDGTILLQIEAGDEQAGQVQLVINLGIDGAKEMRGTLKRHIRYAQGKEVKLQAHERIEERESQVEQVFVPNPFIDDDLIADIVRTIVGEKERRGKTGFNTEDKDLLSMLDAVADVVKSREDSGQVSKAWDLFHTPDKKSNHSAQEFSNVEPHDVHMEKDK